MATRDLPARPNLEQYRKQAKELLKRWKASDPQTARRLADAQRAIAREHGFDTWKTFTGEISRRTGVADKAAIWKSAEDALVAGDDVTLARLLQRRLHDAGPGRDELPSKRCWTAAAAHRCAARPWARIDARGAGGGANADFMINSCLANGRPEAAQYLADRGAPLDLEGAAGIGRLDLVKSFFNTDGSLKPPATIAQRKDGFTWACEYGRTDVVEYLLDHGVEASEILPRPHKQTGLHWAAYGGHIDTVKALLKRRPRLDVRDASFGGTPLGWAVHGWWDCRDGDPARKEPYYEIVALLVDAGAPVESDWLNEENAQTDPRMFAALTGKCG
jgi:hypothetical protein